MKTLAYLALIIFSSLESQEVIVRSPDGHSFVIDVEQDRSFAHVICDLQQTFHYQGDYLLDFMAISPSKPLEEVASKAVIRDYYSSPTSKQKEDIAYIVNTLGMCSLIKIKKSEDKLKEAGDRVESVHPLRFLMTIFSNEETKAAIHAMDGRRWVWSKFTEGLKKSLAKETSAGNMKDEFIIDHAGIVGIQADILLKSSKECQRQNEWGPFIDLHLKYCPRNENCDRYKM